MAQHGHFSNLFAGVGLGLLVGLIAGLSVSPVVSVILGALAALLAAFLGLSGGEKPPEDPEQRAELRHQQRLKGLRAGSFGLACAVAILAGVFIRSSDAFAPPLNTQIDRWVKAGYDPKDAREYVVFEQLGVTPGWKDVQFTEVQKRKTRGLFSGESDLRLCDEIQPEKFGHVSSKVLNGWRAQSNPPLTELADEITALELNEADSRILITAITGVLCATESSKQ